MDATTLRFSTPEGSESTSSTTCGTPAGLEPSHSLIFTSSAMDPASAAAAATFRIVGATVDTVVLLARAYGGTVAGDIILNAAQVLGQLGRGGRAAVPTPAHVRAVSTVSPGLMTAPPLASGTSPRAGAAHSCPPGGAAGGDGGDADRPTCPDCCVRPASLPSPRTLKMLDPASPTYDPAWVWPKYCAFCRAARKAADAGAAARPAVGARAAVGTMATGAPKGSRHGGPE